MEDVLNPSPRQSKKKKPKTSWMNPQDDKVIKEMVVSNGLILILRPFTEAGSNRHIDEEEHKSKGMDIKGKSAEIGPIEGEIPEDAGLSKAHNLSPEKQLQLQNSIHALVAKRNDLVKDIASIKPEEIEKINSSMPVTSITKTINGVEVLYLKNAANEILRDEDDRPCYYQFDNNTKQYFYYNYDTKKFDQPVNVLPNNYQIHPVKILAYERFSYNKEKQIAESKAIPIAADYDPLVIGFKKPFLFYDDNDITKILKLTSDQAKNRLELTRAIVLYECHSIQEQYQIELGEPKPNIGYLNEQQLGAIYALKLDTDDWISHGPESSNPAPGPLEDGKYMTYLPSGEKIELHNQKEICNFINEKTEECFQIEINTKWGWEKDEKGKYFIPEHPFDWEQVHKDMNNLTKQVITLTSEFEELLQSRKIQNTEKNIAILLTKFSEIDNITNDLTISLEDVEGIEKNFSISNQQLGLIKQKYNSMISNKNQLEKDRQAITLKFLIEKHKLSPPLKYDRTDHRLRRQEYKHILSIMDDVENIVSKGKKLCIQNYQEKLDKLLNEDKITQLIIKKALNIYNEKNQISKSRVSSQSLTDTPNDNNQNKEKEEVFNI